ncbi:Meckel syndrome type 1 protein homolog [Drosophila novamexicana]|uniref:Meckel syndrome type 1 protein homolog n=1 Tax=Drosophila novamexicana TaxID=47314 RepID=UPI0011E5A1E8|nr:Meckel syndrome type 1 protein homolog [Drosophila novamexicana]
MYRNSAPKRTGIYRVKGNIADLRLELKLRHVSEWLPVPKFEYTGAKVNYGDHYPESPRSGGWSDCFIYVPYEDQYGNNYYAYYNYYNPGSDYPGSSRTSRSRSSSSAAAAAAGRTYPSSSHSQLGEQPVDAAFSALNPELCNGSTASLRIGWQQKHFSRTELERYGDASQCITTLQRRYHRWTRHIVELQRRHRLRVQREEAEQQIRVRRRRKSKRKSARSKTPPLSSLAISEYSVETQPAPPPDDPNFAARTCLVHTLIDADLRELPEADWPPEARQLHDQGYQLMFVYAQLQRDTLLLSLRYQPAEGLLYVYPDFSTTADDMDYVLQIDNDCRQLYAYGFHQAAIDAAAANSSQPPDQLLEQLPTPPADSLPGSEASAEQLVSYYQAKRSGASALRRLLQFQLPPKRMRRVTLLLQLHEAQHFEYPNIHVRYYVNPPSHTLLEPANPNDPFPLRGATATSVAGGASRLAHFSHCWQLTLLCEESHEPHQLLHIYFEVISIDGWQRERCEGYAHFACSLLSPLPAAASAGLRLQCIRPMGSWLDALNRYFIGGRSLFDFVGYFKSRSRDNLMHNRLEAGRSHIMRSTGTLLFSLQKLQQRHQPLGHLLAPEDSDDDDSPAPGHRDKPAVSATLQEVLVAYVEARERIEALLGQSALV